MCGQCYAHNRYVTLPDTNSQSMGSSRSTNALKEIGFQERIYQEKPIFQGLQRLWKVVRCAGIYIECNTYATNILICIGRFSVVILGNVLFCAFLQAVQQTVNRPR